MKYTQNLLIKACLEFAPTFTEEVRRVAHLQLPELVKLASLEAFVVSDETEFKISGDKAFAAHLLKIALVELKETGDLSFGTANEYWL